MRLVGRPYAVEPHLPIVGVQTTKPHSLITLLDAKHTPAGSSSDVAGVSNATSGSITDKLTREHRMTIDEAYLILNLKRGEPMEQIVKVRLI